MDPSSQILSGTVTTTAVVVDVSLSTMELDFSTGMTVSAATSGGASASFTHSNNLVTVTLDQTYATGDTVVVSVTYSGNPAGSVLSEATIQLRCQKPSHHARCFSQSPTASTGCRRSRRRISTTGWRPTRSGLTIAPRNAWWPSG